MCIYLLLLMMMLFISVEVMALLLFLVCENDEILHNVLEIKPPVIQ